MKMRVFLTIMASLLLFTTSAKADRIAASNEVVITMVDAAQAILRDTNLDETQTRIALKETLNKYFDVPGITRATAGQYWRKATAEQQQRNS